MGIFSWLGSRGSRENGGWLRRWVIPSAGPDNPKIDEIQQAAAEDVEEIEEEGRRYFRPDGPGSREDDL